MKGKAWMSAFLCAALVLTMVPMAASAATRPEAPASCTATDSQGQSYTCHRVEEDEVYVGGTRVGETSEVEYYLNDGTGGITSENASAANFNVSYDPASSTLTLMGANLSKTAYTDHRVQYETQQYPQDVSHDAVILARKAITIKVVGKNTIENKRQAPEATYTGLHRHGIDVFADLTIIGDGTESSSLTSKGSDQNTKDWADSIGINVLGGDLLVENLSLTAQGRQSTYSSVGLYVGNGDMTLRNSDVSVLSGNVAPISQAAVALSWTESCGMALSSQAGSANQFVIDNSSVEVQAGDGYYSGGIFMDVAESGLTVKNNSVLKVTASKEAAVSYGIMGSLTVDKSHVEAVSLGAKDIPYTYGGTTYQGYAYSYGYWADTSYKLKVNTGTVCFMSGPCESGTVRDSCALFGEISALDYSESPYAVARYNQDANAQGAETWTDSCTAVDTDNALVLKSGYQYFDITHTFTPHGTIEWVGNGETARPESLDLSLRRAEQVTERVTVSPDQQGKWAFTFAAQPVYNCQVTGNYRASDAWDLIDYTLTVENQPEEFDLSLGGSAFAEQGFAVIETYVDKTDSEGEKPDVSDPNGDIPPSDPQDSAQPTLPVESPHTGSQPTDNPQTGDTGHLTVWIVMAGAAALGLGVLSLLQKRRVRGN